MSWPTHELGPYVDILSGFAFKSNKFNAEGIGMPLIRIRDVVPGKTATYYDGPYDAQFVVNTGEILIGMDGEFNCARWNGGASLLNQRVCRIKTKNDRLNEAYLFWFLPDALKLIEQQTPFVTVKHLSVKDIRAIRIPMPSVQEQERIAAIFGQADQIRLKHLQAADMLNSLLGAFRQRAFRGEL